MKVRIHIKGGASSVDGELPVDKEEEIPKFLEEKIEFFILKRKVFPAIVAKSSIGYIERAQ